MHKKADTHSVDQIPSCAKNGGYSVEEVQALLGVSMTTVYGIIRANLFHYTYKNGCYEISKPSFEQWFTTLDADIDECHRTD